MAASTAFLRIERDILRLCSSIPAGKVCTFADLGAVIDVPARHVAYIVSRLDGSVRAQVPVHRLVGAGGKLPAKPADLAQQLGREGVQTSRGVVSDLPSVLLVPSAATARTAKVERTTRPPEHTRSKDGSAALADMRGLGPVSVKMLVGAGITSAAQLRKADLFKLYATIKSTHPRTSINLLYAMMGAVDNQDWRQVAKDRRTEVLMQLEDRGLL
jgi:DNA transformation protein and related proteins